MGLHAMLAYVCAQPNRAPIHPFVVTTTTTTTTTTEATDKQHAHSVHRTVSESERKDVAETLTTSHIAYTNVSMYHI